MAAFIVESVIIAFEPRSVSHHLPPDGVFAAEVSEGYDASELGWLVIHAGKLDQRRKRSAVAKLLSALLLLVALG